MKKTTVPVLAVATALFAFASSAQAQDASTPKLYGELGYTQLSAKASDGVDALKFSPSAVSGVFGYQFMPWLAVEGQVGIGASKGKIKLNGADTGVNGKVKSTAGVFLKPSVAVSDSIDLFGRVGWVHTELELSAGGVSNTGRGSDIAYGVGANFNFSKTSYVQASWMNYYKKDGLKVDGFAVAYGMRF